MSNMAKYQFSDSDIPNSKASSLEDVERVENNVVKYNNQPLKRQTPKDGYSVGSGTLSS